ncbi:MAG: DUF4129 domain-containing protein [Gemmatimonadetes bacterium]|nr:DUF4129 domain-containing protein [Gemmatimonadota bacterium]
MIPSQEPIPSPERVSSELRDILSDPDFATFEAPLRQQILEWVFRRVGELWNWVRGLLGEDGAGTAQTVVIVVALVALVVMVLVASRHASRVRARQGDEDDPEPEAPLTAREWLTAASRQARGGAFRPAATALYQGFLLTLEQQGLLSFHGSKTPGDYATEITRVGPGAAGHGEMAGGRFLASFQRFSFGQEEPTAGGYAQLARMAREAGCPIEGPSDEQRESGAASA